MNKEQVAVKETLTEGLKTGVVPCFWVRTSSPIDVKNASLMERCAQASDLRWSGQGNAAVYFFAFFCFFLINMLRTC